MVARRHAGSRSAVGVEALRNARSASVRVSSEAARSSRARTSACRASWSARRVRLCSSFRSVGVGAAQSMWVSRQRRNALGRGMWLGQVQPRCWVSVVSWRARSRPVHRVVSIPVCWMVSQIFPMWPSGFSAGAWARSSAAARWRWMGRGVVVGWCVVLPACACVRVGEILKARALSANPPEGDRGSRVPDCGWFRVVVLDLYALVRSVAREGFLGFVKGGVTVMATGRGVVSAQVDAARNWRCPWCDSAAIASRRLR